MSGCCGCVDEYPVEPYTDPILQRNCRQYLRLIKKLDRLHVIWNPPSSRTCWHFLRSIKEFEDQDDTGRKEDEPKVLPTARLLVAMRFFEESVAHLATADVDNCFYRLRVGQSLAE